MSPGVTVMVSRRRKRTLGTPQESNSARERWEARLLSSYLISKLAVGTVAVDLRARVSSLALFLLIGEEVIFTIFVL